MNQIKVTLKKMLFRKGWFLRKNKGLSWGVDLEIDWTRIKLPYPKIIFDVGAHKGESIDYFKNIFPSAFFFSFEPVNANYEALTKRFKFDKNVKCFKLALGESCGESLINLGVDSQTHSLKGSPDMSQTNKEKIKVSSIDSTLSNLGVDRIDLLKIDTEGYEIKVLNGARSALTAKKISAILCEATLNLSDPIHTSLAELCEFLRPFGYTPLAIYDQTVWTSPPRPAYLNILFIENEKIIFKKNT